MTQNSTILIKIQSFCGRHRSNIGLRLLVWTSFWAAAMGISVWIVQILSLGVFQIYFPLRCPLKFFFGMACPTCGLGRSIIYFLAGEWRSSWDAHFLGAFVVLILVPATFVWAINARFMEKFEE